MVSSANGALGGVVQRYIVLFESDERKQISLDQEHRNPCAYERAAQAGGWPPNE